MSDNLVYITRRERFSAAHKLARDEWSEEKNLQVFGKCSNPNWHGHNYIMHITVKGVPNKETGFVLDLSELSQLVKTHIIDHVDHKNINVDVPFFKDIMASTENLAIAFWNQLESHIEPLGAKLHCIKLQETENNYVEYYG